MHPITRQEAKRIGFKQYFTGKPCPSGHVVPRWVSDKKCSACKAEQAKQYWDIFKSNRDYAAYSLKKNREWRARNPERLPELMRRYYALNHHRVRAYGEKRNWYLLKARPIWADLAKIEAIYNSAREKTEATGIPHHVDHIYPLCGETMCGLHVETNLRVITAEENMRKGNRVPI